MALLNSLSKIYEKIIHTRLLSFFKKNKTISPAQHGFLKGRSTTSALYKFVEELYSSIDKTEYSLGLFCDLSKAFDCLNHSILLDKLYCYGIRGKAHNLIRSYLYNRSQIVQISDTHSPPFNSLKLQINSGIPQGSILGPLLFVIYINDISHKVNRGLIMYADDCTIKISSKSTEELTQSAQTCLSDLYKWFQSNHLAMNLTKTNVIPFKQLFNYNFNIGIGDNSFLNKVESTRLLGITIDTKLKWNCHVENVCNNLAKLCYATKRLANICSLEVLLNTYYGLAYPILKYNNIFWGNSSKANLIRVFKLQKWLIRNMVKVNRTTSCKTYFSELKILTFPSLIIYESCLFVKKHRDYFTANETSHRYETRNQGQLVTNAHHTSLYQKGPSHFCIKAFNSIPPELKTLPNLNTFKRKLKQFLVGAVFYDLDHIK